MARKRTKDDTKRLVKIGGLVALATRPGSPSEGKAAMNALKRMGATAAEIKRGAAAKRREEERRTKELEEERQGEAAPPVAKAAPAKAAREPLTTQIIKDLVAPASGNRIRFDNYRDVPGLGIRITANGHRAFVLSYTVRHTGRERRYTIGAWPSWTLSMARTEAKRLRRDIDLGNDPLADIQAKRDAETVGELIDRFTTEYLPEQTRASTQADYERILRVHALPALKRSTKIADVTTDDIKNLHRKITKAGHSVRANATVRVLRCMFNLAVNWGMCDTNPAKGISFNTEIKRERYLGEEDENELPRLWAALAAHPNKESANIFRVLLLTGCRRGEALGMRWGHVNLQTGKWSKPASSTKQGKPHRVPLSEPVVALLSEIRDQQLRKGRGLPEHIFSGGGSPAHVVQIKRCWQRICKSANLVDLTIHDLRHNFASTVISQGATLALTGNLLGHGDLHSTQRYAHHFDSAQRAAVEKVGTAITAAGRKVARR